MIASVKLCLAPFLQEEEDRSSQLFGRQPLYMGYFAQQSISVDNVFV
jgi:hypothetical protein